MNPVRTFVFQEAGAMRRGTWRLVIDDERARVTAALCCPGCSGVGVLEAEHSITADGDVQPAVACYSDGCTFNEHVHLAGWPGSKEAE